MAKGKYMEWLTEEALLKLEAWARDGLTDKQIAHNMGIGERTLYEYKERYPQISQSLKKGKEVVDIEVENSLLKRALGYSYDEVTTEKRTNPETGEKITISRKTVTKEQAPDVTAIIFWLKNRKPDVWRDKQQQEVTHSGEIKTGNPFEGLTTEELRELIKIE